MQYAGICSAHKSPPDSCWYWKKLCDLKDKFVAEYFQNNWMAVNGKYTVKSGYKCLYNHIMSNFYFRLQILKSFFFFPQILRLVKL